MGTNRLRFRRPRRWNMRERAGLNLARDRLIPPPTHIRRMRVTSSASIEWTVSGVCGALRGGCTSPWSSEDLPVSSCTAHSCPGPTIPAHSSPNAAEHN